MNNDLQSLTVLLKQAEEQRDEALVLMQQADKRAQGAQAQAEQLLAYRGQYRQRWVQQFSASAAIEIVQCYQGFGERLEQAIAHQQQVVAQCQAQAERMRELVQQRELRVASVRKLIERRQQEQRRVEERRDQKLTDEAAQRSGWNSNLPSRMVNQFS
ncbi:MAG: flagellar export protein FliJ [Pseudomonadota bacterium]